jgi:hypothetical protein
VRAAPITFSDDALKPASIDGVIVTASLVDLDLGIRTGSGRANRVISAKRAGMSASVSSPKRWWAPSTNANVFGSNGFERTTSPAIQAEARPDGGSSFCCTSSMRSSGSGRAARLVTKKRAEFAVF